MHRLFSSLLLGALALVGIAEAVTVGEPANFRANSDGASNYQWTFPDGSTQNGATAQYTFTESGQFAVTLEVTGTDGQTNQITKNITVQNRDRPTALITAEVDGNRSSGRDVRMPSGSQITLRPDFTEQNQSTLSYFWTVNGQRENGDTLTQSIFDEIGLYQVNLTVFDSTQTHLRDETQIRVIVENQGPEITSMSVRSDTSSQVVQVRASANDPDGNIESYRFEVLENGRSILSQLVSTPEANFNLSQFPGLHTYDFRVTAIDDRQKSTRYDHGESLTVDNQVENTAPELNLIVAPGNEGPIDGYFNFLADTIDEDGDALRYQWVFPNGQQFFSSQVRYRFLEAGEQTVVVRVTDGIETIEDSIVVNVIEPPNEAPEVSITSVLPAKNGDTNTLFRFNALGTDADRDDLTYAWDMGDGGIAISNSPLYRFETAGTYTATVTATDGREEATASTTLQVVEAPTPIGRTPETNNAPTVSVTALNPSGSTKDSFRFNSQASDLDGDRINYTWDMGDGIRYFTPQIHHFYREAGNYEVSLSVSDGIETATESTQVTVIEASDTGEGGTDGSNPENQAPSVRVLSVSPQLTGTPETVFRFYTLGQDPDVDQLTYEWDMGDGNRMFIQNPAYRYESPGQYQVTVIASDGLEQTTDQVTINVEEESLLPSGPTDPENTDGNNPDNQPPVLSITAVAPSTTGDTHTLFQFFTQVNDPDGDVLEFEWDMGDGNTMRDQNPIYRYQEAGSYVVKATVSDGQLDTTSEITVTVTEAELNLNNPENNQAPTTELKAHPLIGDTTTKFRFVSRAIDPDGDNILYDWDMGDGSVYFTETVLHQYSTPGEYPVQVKVSDGLSSSISEVSIKISDQDANQDSDNDGVPDIVEIENGTDPNDPDDFIDENENGIPDYLESNNATESEENGENIPLGAIDQVDFGSTSCEHFATRINTATSPEQDIDFTAAHIALREAAPEKTQALTLVEKWRTRAYTAYTPMSVAESELRAADWQALTKAGLKPEQDFRTAQIRIIRALKPKIEAYRTSQNQDERSDLKQQIQKLLYLRSLLNKWYNLSEDKFTLTTKKARLQTLKAKWEKTLNDTIDAEKEASLEKNIADATTLLSIIDDIEAVVKAYFLGDANAQIERCQAGSDFSISNIDNLPLDQLINAVADMEGTVDTTFFLYAKAFAPYQDRPLLFEWNLGDNRSSGGQNIFFRYPQPGLYEVTLNISDELTQNQDRLRIRVYETWPYGDQE